MPDFVTMNTVNQPTTEREQALYQELAGWLAKNQYVANSLAFDVWDQV
jgi:hypothetical protein